MKTEKTRLFGYYDLSEKARKNIEILELIKKKGVISRSDISRITGINIISVSNYIKEYIDKKIVFEKGPDVSTGGRPPELVGLNAKSNYVIGLDIDGPDIKIALADLSVNVADKIKHTASNSAKLPDELITLISNLLERSGVATELVKAIGIGSSDDNPLPAARALEKSFNADIFVGGRAHCAAFGEKRLNPAAADVESIIYMHSSIGRGIVIKDDICLDESSAAAGLEEKLQYLKPWDESLSLESAARQEVSRGIGTKIVGLANGRVENITESVVIEAAKLNDEVALNIVQATSINLGLRIAYLINLFSPKAVLIGGEAIEKAGELVLSPIRKMVKRLALSNILETVKVDKGLLGEDAVLLGAATLAVREVFLKA